MADGDGVGLMLGMGLSVLMGFFALWCILCIAGFLAFFIFIGFIGSEAAGGSRSPRARASGR